MPTALHNLHKRVGVVTALLAFVAGAFGPFGPLQRFFESDIVGLVGTAPVVIVELAAFLVPLRIAVFCGNRFVRDRTVHGEFLRRAGVEAGVGSLVGTTLGVLAGRVLERVLVFGTLLDGRPVTVDSVSSVGSSVLFSLPPLVTLSYSILPVAIGVALAFFAGTSRGLATHSRPQVLRTASLIAGLCGLLGGFSIVMLPFGWLFANENPVLSWPLYGLVLRVIAPLAAAIAIAFFVSTPVTRSHTGTIAAATLAGIVAGGTTAYGYLVVTDVPAIQTMLSSATGFLVTNVLTLLVVVVIAVFAGGALSRTVGRTATE
ncbi:hypothetical protein [Haloferax sp. DFSO60]|uniref:hypothetical protein n=1 Tax=Haloferax sp. DFSO60 TaxID=3388652 RepID=UPI00397D75CA